jgi:hypothetical protein
MAMAWFYKKNDTKYGPVDTATLKRMAAGGELAPSDLIWREGLSGWVEASRAKGLFPDTPRPLVRDLGQVDGAGPGSQAVSQIACPGCKQRIDVPVALLGTIVACTSCGMQIQLPPPPPGTTPASPAAASVMPHKHRRLLVPIIVATAGLLLIAAMAAYFIDPPLKKLPPGWHRHSNKATGLSIACPPGWEFLSSAEFNVKFSTRTAIRLPKRDVVCINTKDEDQNCWISYNGDISRVASSKEKAREFLRQNQPKESDMSGRQHLVSQKICDLAGGVASKTIIEEGQQERSEAK